MEVRKGSEVERERYECETEKHEMERVRYETEVERLAMERERGTRWRKRDTSG